MRLNSLAIIALVVVLVLASGGPPVASAETMSIRAFLRASLDGEPALAAVADEPNYSLPGLDGAYKTTMTIEAVCGMGQFKSLCDMLGLRRSYGDVRQYIYLDVDDDARELYIKADGIKPLFRLGWCGPVKYDVTGNMILLDKKNEPECMDSLREMLKNDKYTYRQSADAIDVSAKIKPHDIVGWVDGSLSFKACEDEDCLAPGKQARLAKKAEEAERRRLKLEAERKERERVEAERAAAEAKAKAEADALKVRAKSAAGGLSPLHGGYKATMTIDVVCNMQQFKMICNLMGLRRTYGDVRQHFYLDLDDEAKELHIKAGGHKPLIRLEWCGPIPYETNEDNGKIILDKKKEPECMKKMRTMLGRDTYKFFPEEKKVRVRAKIKPHDIVGWVDGELWFNPCEESDETCFAPN